MVGAMDDKVRALLDELRATIERSEADGVIDDEERTELRSLFDRLDATIAAQDGERDGDQDDDEGLTDALEEAAIRFEGRHPTVAAVIRSAVDTLAGYGI
jgi:hypothetical protein